MGVKNGRPIGSPDGYPQTNPTVVVKTKPGGDARTFGAGPQIDGRVAAELAPYPDVVLSPYFDESGPTIFNQMPETDRGDRRDDLANVSKLVVPVDDAQRVVDLLAGKEFVEEVYIESGPTPPPSNSVNFADDTYSAHQTYLDAAPVGIDAKYAWQHTDGSGVGVVDLEQGWTLDHEDLRDRAITLISGQSLWYHGHGTSVLGEILGTDNKIGIIGQAPSGVGRVVSQWRTNSEYSTSKAIYSAIAVMQPGDVLLLEAQVGTYPRYLPVEVETLVFDAIVKAVSQGIVVVEAAGNGFRDLDHYKSTKGEFILRRGHRHFKDSGAIMVGASSAAIPHSRMDFSNYGSRVDCYAWGEKITTTGDGYTSTALDDYTNDFGGTSGASPMIVGAIMLVQSFAKALGRAAFSPAALRTMLASPVLSTPSANPSVDKIGTMPNLRALIERIRSVA